MARTERPVVSLRCFPSMYRMSQTRKRALILACLAAAILLFNVLVFESKKHSRSQDPNADENECPKLSKFALDSEMAMRWEGFQPEEKGQYNFTVVSAMMDIGRGFWPHQERTYSEYLLHMMRVMRLDVNFVIFVDAKGRPFIEWMRRGRESRTRIIEVRIEDLPYYPYKDRVKEIMNSPEYRKDNQLVQQNLCESREPIYNILQWSNFMDEAIKLNAHRTEFFFLA